MADSITAALERIEALEQENRLLRESVQRYHEGFEKIETIIKDTRERGMAHARYYGDVVGKVLREAALDGSFTRCLDSEV